MVRLSLPFSFFFFTAPLVVSLDGGVIRVDQEVGLICRLGEGLLNRTSFVYALQNWLSESPDQAARKPGSNPGILGVAMGLMAVFVVCYLLPFSPPPLQSQSSFFSSFRATLGKAY